MGDKQLKSSKSFGKQGIFMSIKSIIKEGLGEIYYNLYHRYTKSVGNRVILYHSIGTKLVHDTYGISISKERFEEHMRYIKDNYEILPLDNDYKNNLEKNSISITFDDGYKDNLIALEICQKYNIPFTLYITTDNINQDTYLSEVEILEFAKSDLCILGTHSTTHPHLASLAYDEQYHQLADSKKKLEDIISKEVYAMSYPHGSHNDDTLKIVQEVGYTMVGSSIVGINTKSNFDYKKIKRSEIVANDDIKLLSKKISGYYDYVAWRG